MPKIEIATLIESGIYPDSASIKKSLGKRDFTLYEMYEGHDLDKAEFLLKLGRRFERNPRALTFGTEKIYKSGLCYALAALLNNVNGYKYLIGAIKKQMFLHEFSDSRLTSLLEICEDKKKALELMNFTQSLLISDAILLDLLNKVNQPVEMILAQRLDVAYDIYSRASVLLSQIGDSPEKKNITTAKKSAIKLMSAILDTDDEKRLLRLMNLRMAKRELDPEYIPGKSPKKQVRLPDPLQANKKAKYHWRHLAKLALASVRGKVLTVSERAKNKDADENTRFLSSKERDAHRVIIRQGKFYERDLSNEYTECDTRYRVSHGKEGYMAITINMKGELSLFDHFEILDGFAHSSMNAQAPLFFAGEIQILNGEFRALTVYSMHYKPSLSNVYDVLEHFHVHGVDLSHAVVQTWGESGKYNGNHFLNYQAADFYEHFTLKGLDHLTLLSTGKLLLPEVKEDMFNASTKMMRESLNVGSAEFDDFEADFSLAPQAPEVTHDKLKITSDANRFDDFETDFSLTPAIAAEASAEAKQEAAPKVTIKKHSPRQK